MTLGLIIVAMLLLVGWRVAAALNRRCTWCGTARPTLRHFLDQHLQEGDDPLPLPEPSASCSSPSSPRFVNQPANWSPGSGDATGVAARRPVRRPPPLPDTFAVADRLLGLDLSARVIWGEADQFQKLRYGELLAADLRTELRRFSGGKHFTPEDHPEVVAGGDQRASRGSRMTHLLSLRADARLLDVFRAYPAPVSPLLDYHEVLMRGESPLSQTERELIVAYMSGLNACDYCIGMHRTTAQAFGAQEGLLTSLLADIETADVDERIRQLLW